MDIIGTNGNDTLVGTVDSDYIDGRLGADSMHGDAGDDAYVVDNVGDVVVEYSGEGEDTVITTLTSYALGAHVEALIYDGDSTANFTGVGNSLDNYIEGWDGNDSLSGGAGDDILDGLGGSDSLVGGTGDDAFFVADSGDVVIEYSGQGHDTVLSEMTSYTLGANVEELLFYGNPSDDFFGTGNALDNYIEGWDGNDVLDGAGGADTLVGAFGDDDYIVDHAGDIVVEDVGAGDDFVFTTLGAYVLSANVEGLVYDGSAAFAGTGNSLDNLLQGASANDVLVGAAGNDLLYGLGGADRLDGGTGADKAIGGLGNDLYIVDNAADITQELVGEGTDVVHASVSLTLRANTENLVLTGTSSIFGKGNELANVITGNGAANKLYGLGGDDRLIGGAGNDLLDGGTGLDKMFGGTGNDIYIVDGSTDQLVEYAGEGTDTMRTTVTRSLGANLENLEILGSAAANGTGNELGNIIKGNAAVNLLYGRAGNDKLYGFGGADVLKGEDGNDWLQGGTGRDRMYGGAGADGFVFDDGDFSGVTSSSADQIHDFGDSEGDRIRLELVDANLSLDGDQAFSFIGSAAFSGSAGQLRVQQSGGNTYVQGDVSGDGIADFWIRLDGLHALNSGDFVF